MLELHGSSTSIAVRLHFGRTAWFCFSKGTHIAFSKFATFHMRKAHAAENVQVNNARQWYTRARAERAMRACTWRRIACTREFVQIRLESTGVDQAGRAGLAARFSKHRKVMKYRERQAKLLMRRGPMCSWPSPLPYIGYTPACARTRRYTECESGRRGARACNFFIKKVFRNKNQTLVGRRDTAAYT